MDTAIIIIIIILLVLVGFIIMLWQLVPQKYAYTTFVGKSSPGNDILQATPMKPEQLQWLCNVIPECKGFNKAGWVKHQILAPDQMPTNANDQTWVKGAPMWKLW